jgi:hypothetical protein
MRAIIRRLCLLEERLVPKIDLAAQRLSDILRERRRRRLEASGEPDDEPLDWGSLGLPPGTRLSESETLRLARPLIWKRNREREERARQAAVSQGGQDDPQRNAAS